MVTTQLRAYSGPPILFCIIFRDFISYYVDDRVGGRVRKTYDGPLTMVEDLMVWNITDEEIRVRLVQGNNDSWGERSPFRPDPPPNPANALVPGAEIMAGEWEEIDALNLEVIKEAYDKYGLDFNPSDFR